MSYRDAIESATKRLGGIRSLYGNTFVPVSPSRLSELENHIGHTLPGDYRQFLSEIGASMFCSCTNIVPPTQVFSDGNYQLFGWFYGFAPEGEEKVADSHSLRWAWRVFQDQLPQEGLLPIGNDGGGDIICIGLAGSQRGKIYFWERTNPEDKLYLVSNSFAEFLHMLQLREA